MRDTSAKYFGPVNLKVYVKTDQWRKASGNCPRRGSKGQAHVQGVSPYSLPKSSEDAPHRIISLRPLCTMCDETGMLVHDGVLVAGVTSWEMAASSAEPHVMAARPSQELVAMTSAGLHVRCRIPNEDVSASLDGT